MYHEYNVTFQPIWHPPDCFCISPNGFHIISNVALIKPSDIAWLFIHSCAMQEVWTRVNQLKFLYKEGQLSWKAVGKYELDPFYRGNCTAVLTR